MTQYRPNPMIMQNQGGQFSSGAGAQQFGTPATPTSPRPGAQQVPIGTQNVQQIPDEFLVEELTNNTGKLISIVAVVGNNLVQDFTGVLNKVGRDFVSIIGLAGPILIPSILIQSVSFPEISKELGDELIRILADSE